MGTRNSAMASSHVIALLAILLLVLPGAACTRHEGPAEAANPPAATSEPAAEVTMATPGLAGTSWQLVRIASMDDTVTEPDDRSHYTIAFHLDGRAAVRADCNRGNGSWTTKGSKLEFGPLAMTRAMCPPGSLYDRFVSELGYVRSFVIEDGRLHLATMADGSILEFEPAAD